MELVLGVPVMWLVLGSGFVITLLTSLFKQPFMSSKVKNIIAIVVSVLAATLTAVLTGDVNTTTDILVVVTSMYGTSQIFYKFLMQGGSLDTRLTNALVMNGDDEDDEA